MSRLLDKAKKKVKKAGQVMDRLRSPSHEGKPGSGFATSHQSGQSIGYSLEPSPPQLVSTVPEPSAAALPNIALVSPSVASSSSAGPIVTAAGGSSPALAPMPPLIPIYAQVPSLPNSLETTGSAVRGLLAAVRDGSDLILPLKAALVGIVALWNLWDRTAEAKAEFLKLESKLAAFKAIADAHRDHPREVDQSLQIRLDSITHAVQGLWEAVERRQARGGVARVSQSSIDISDIKSLADAISSLLEVFQFESSIAVEKRLGHIVERLNEEKNEDLRRERVRKQEDVTKSIKTAFGDNFVSEAADDEQPSYAGCMPGTRVGVLSKFVAWVKNDPMSIFWLAGMVGTGKTSIAVSLCRMLRKDPNVCLGGGYFCSRSAGSIARTDVRRIIPTLATLLAGQSQEFAEALATELEKDRRVSHKPVAEQIGPLLSKPLATLASSLRPLVFVIDALDECSSERELAELLKTIAEFECDAKVKFILTSRPEIHIRGSPISNPDHNSILHLHTIGEGEVRSDIRLYINGTLKSAAGDATWYTDNDIQLLVKQSAGLFIFASTVLMYVLEPDEDDDREERLHKATTVTIAKGTAATNAIDKVYELVLSEASRPDIVDSDERERMRRIIASILTARLLLSVQALADLLELKPGNVRGSLRRLHSLIHIPANDTEPGLRTLHASFGDFLYERAPPHLRIAVTHGHSALARGCLQRMLWDDLCFNIARSRSSLEPNPEVPPDWITLSLIYACLHWAHHIDGAAIHSAFDEGVGRVFRAKFLFWLEVLSVTGRLRLASGLLRIAGLAVYQQSVSHFLRDANAFVASSYAAISKSALHIYVSALQFAAKDSLVYREFASLCRGAVSVMVDSTDRHSSRLLMTLTGHENEINSVSYSPDGQLLVSGSKDGTVRIWNTRTGEETMSPLRSGDGNVLSVAFAPNGFWIASGTSSGVVHVWEVSTGCAALQPLRGHSAQIRSVTFSPNSMFIASASYDKTVRLWNAETGNEIFVLSGHTHRVYAVAISPNSQLLASASFDKTVRLWSMRTGEAVGFTLTGIDACMRCLTFSPDGKYLAAGSHDTSVVGIWDLETLAPTPIVIDNQSSTRCIAFSPDMTRLVLAGWQRIRFWDPRGGRELSSTSLACDLDWVNSIAFSPDGQFLASGSSDPAIRIWEAISELEPATEAPQTHNATVTSVAVSPDGNFIVSGSADHSVRVWNTLTGEARLQPLLGHKASVRAVAISPDGQSIASVSKDQTVRFWDARTGDPIGSPLRGHSDEIHAVAFSPDSRWLATGSLDTTVLMWDVATRNVTPIGALRCRRRVLAVAFSPDGQLLATGGYGGDIQLWVSGTNQLARAPLHANSKEIRAIDFSPDGRRIVSGAEDNAVRVWDIDGGFQVLLFDGRVSWVRSVAYSPDGRYIASASKDRTVRLCDAKTGIGVATIFGHGDKVTSVAFTPDGRFIVSGARDKTIQAWDVEMACSLSSGAEHGPLAQLGSAAFDNDGWLMGPSGELLLWVPMEYRGCLQLPPCSMFIGPRRISLTIDDQVETDTRQYDRRIVYWGNTTQSAVPYLP